MQAVSQCQAHAESRGGDVNSKNKGALGKKQADSFLFYSLLLLEEKKRRKQKMVSNKRGKPKKKLWLPVHMEEVFQKAPLLVT